MGILFSAFQVLCGLVVNCFFNFKMQFPYLG